LAPDVDENERLEEFVEGFSLDPGVNVIKQSFLVIGGRKKLECLSIAIFFQPGADPTKFYGVNLQSRAFHC